MADTLLRREITKRHPRYNTRKAAFDNIAAAYACDDTGLLTSAHIVRHTFESRSAYAKRVSRAFAVPVLRGIVNKIVRAIFSGSILRSGAALERLRPIIFDATGTGTPLNQYMTAIARSTLLYNGGFTLVDYAVDADRYGDSANNITLADVHSNPEFIPHLRFFSPAACTNWSLIPRYGYEAIVFSEKRVIDGQEKDVYVYADYEVIEELDSGGKPLEGTQEWQHNLGYTPVFGCSFISGAFDSDLGQALYPFQKAIANLCSVVDEICERHAFSQLIVPDDGNYAEMQAKESDMLRAGAVAGMLDGDIETGHDSIVMKMANSAAFTFPTGTGHPPQFISPDVSELNAVWKVVPESIKLIMQTLGIANANGDIDEGFVAAIAAELTVALAEHERKCIAAACSYLSIDPAEYSVSYPAFNVERDTGWITTCSAIAKQTWLSVEARSLLIQQELERSLPYMTAVDYKTIIDGIVIEEVAEVAPAAPGDDKEAKEPAESDDATPPTPSAG